MMRSQGMRWLLLLALGCGADNSESPPPETPQAEPEPEVVQNEPEPAPREEPGTREAPVRAFAAASWTTLLETYVVDAGFRYEALRSNEEHVAMLSRIVDSVATADESVLSRNQALAFYINAYNVLTIHSVLELWPVESVMQEEGFFDQRSHVVAGSEMTLNDLENDVIRDRERFGDPRIHFAVNCASVGCPPLQREAFTAENLERLLAAGAQAFVRNTTQIDRRPNRIEVTKLFEWFADDFGGADGVREFIANQLEGDDAAFVRREQTTIAHFDYDWTLNAAE